MNWQEDHIQIVIDLWKAGKTYQYIADHSLELVGKKYSKSAVANRLLRSRHGTKGDPINRAAVVRVGGWSPRHLERVRELLQAGKRYGEVSDTLFEEFGYRWSGIMIANRLLRLRKKTGDLSYSAARPSVRPSVRPSTWRLHTDQLKALVKAGRSCTEIAETLNREFGLNVTKGSVAGRIFRLRLAGDATLRSQGVRRRGKDAQPRKRSHKPAEPRARKSVPLELKHGIVCVGFPLDIVELAMTRGRCHWPLWQDTDGHYDRLYCGNEAMTGCSYCAEHYALGYYKPRRRNPLERKLAAKAHNRFVNGAVRYGHFDAAA